MSAFCCSNKPNNSIQVCWKPPTNDSESDKGWSFNESDNKTQDEKELFTKRYNLPAPVQFEIVQRLLTQYGEKPKHNPNGRRRSSVWFNSLAAKSLANPEDRIFGIAAWLHTGSKILVRKDEEAALYWYSKAIVLGDCRAMNNVAVLYGEKGNSLVAMDWLLLASKYSDPVVRSTIDGNLMVFYCRNNDLPHALAIAESCALSNNERRVVKKGELISWMKIMNNMGCLYAVGVRGSNQLALAQRCFQDVAEGVGNRSYVGSSVEDISISDSKDQVKSDKRKAKEGRRSLIDQIAAIALHNINACFLAGSKRNGDITAAYVTSLKNVSSVAEEQLIFLSTLDIVSP